MLQSVTARPYLTHAVNIGEQDLMGPPRDSDRYRLRLELEKCIGIRDALMTLKENVGPERVPEIERALLKIMQRIAELEGALRE